MPSSRLFYIDNLRILLTVLVILVHLAITYGAPGDWYFTDAPLNDELSKILMTLFVAVSQSFFMGMFFLISAHFASGSIDRKGPTAFFKDRLLRLGVPLVFFVLFLSPLVKYSIARFADGTDEPFLAFYFHYLGHLHGGNVGPMWFVEFLLILSAFLCILQIALGRWMAKGTSKHKAPGNIGIAAFAIGLGLVTFVVRLWMPRGTEFAPLHLQIPYTPQYVALFFVGILAARQNWFATLPLRSAKIWGVVVLAMLAAFPVIVIIGSGADGDLSVFDGGMNWQSLVAALWEQMIGLAIMVVLIVVFRSTLNGQNRLTGALSNSAYAVFIIHPVVIVPLAIAFAGVEFGSQTKFLIFGPALVCATFLVGYVIKQTPIVRAIV